MKQKQEKADLKHKLLTVIGTVLCVILLPILIMNITLIARSYLNADEVPSIGGNTPLIVLTDSMLPEISSGDLIITKHIDAEDVQVGDVIAFFDPASKGSSVVTHRVIEIVDDKGVTKWRTRGDNNNTEDRTLVPFENLVGIYRGTRIPGAGNVAMFLQTVPGLIVCVVCPLLLLVGYDVIRRRKYEKAQQADTDALLAELEALRAMQAGKNNSVKDESEENQ